MSPQPGSLVEVHLNARLSSVQRGDRYEDPLAFWLEGAFPGSRVLGGGTLRSPEGEPMSCAIRAEVTGDPVAVGAAIAEFLTDIGAPRGSSVRVGDRPALEFGAAEGLAVYLDGTGLPQQVYDDHDINVFLDELHDRLIGYGSLQSYWEGPTSTAVYAYGERAGDMTAAMSVLLDHHPLAVGSRLERIA